MRDARGSEGSVVLVRSLQPDARPVVPDIFPFPYAQKLSQLLLLCAVFDHFKLQLMQGSL